MIDKLTSGKIEILKYERPNSQVGKPYGLLLISDNIFISFQYSRKLIHIWWILKAIFGDLPR